MPTKKLGITDEVELSKVEEKVTKKKALELFDLKKIDEFEIGTFKGLSDIHKFLFSDIYDFAGLVRKDNISKGSFRFASSLYLSEVLSKIDSMPHNNFDEIVRKYVEMNLAHPFRDGKGRSTRIWLDMMFKKCIGKVVDWSLIDREEYLMAMERSPINDLELKTILKIALTDKINDRTVYMKGIDQSYKYEGYNTYILNDLDNF